MKKRSSRITLHESLIISFAEQNSAVSTLLGAAGIAGIAIGFAAQTSISNLISGLFLIGENPCNNGRKRQYQIHL